MERKIGETFDYDGITIVVVEDTANTCIGCFFFNVRHYRCHENEDYIGRCCNRTIDFKSIIFKKVDSFKFLK